MVPHLDIKTRFEPMPEATASQENGVLLVDSQSKNLKCETMYEDWMHRSTLETPVACTHHELAVNETEHTNFRGNGLGKAEVEEETESSSSFDDSDSDIENRLSDSENALHIHGDSTSDIAINEFGDFFGMRRRKLTPHWKTFIEPLMWRFKWLELQIRKCNAQALKYEKDLAAYTPKKCFQSENFSKEGFCAKSLPFSLDVPREKIMRRKKRRKIEDAADIASYMSNHSLFSYEGKDNRAGNGSRMDEDLSIQAKMNGDHEPEVDERLWLRPGDGNDLMEGVLRKIDFLQSKVNNLKSRVNKVTSENADKFHLVDDLGLLVPANGVSSPVGSLASPPTSGGRIPVQSTEISSELLSQYNMSSVGIPESAVSSIGDGVVGCSGQPGLQNERMNVEDKVLMCKNRPKEEINNFDEGIIELKEKAQVEKSSSQGTSTTLDEPDLATDDQPAPKIRSIAKLIAPKGKKKRGKRRASSSRWSRRSSG